MTFGFALVAIGSVLMLSGWENVPIVQVLNTLRQTPKEGSTSFSSYLSGAGSSVGEAFTGSGSSAEEVGSVKGLNVIGATPTKAAAIAKGVAWATSVTGRYPYKWGGGHIRIGHPNDGEAGGPPGTAGPPPGYDCSGTVSGVLWAMGLLEAALTSGSLAGWGEPGPGKYITIYANAAHTFMKIGGVWFGTGSDKEALRGGPAWGNHDPELSAYSVRHPPGF